MIDRPQVLTQICAGCSWTSVDCHQPVHQPALHDLLFEHALALPSLLPGMMLYQHSCLCCADLFVPYLPM